MELRKWQAEALEIVKGKWRPDTAPVIRAVMGAGKSILMAAICKQFKGTVLVTAPSVKLVEQLAATLEAVTFERVGRYYTHSKTIERITVCCYPSLAALVETGYQADAWIADECHRTEVEAVMDAINGLAPKMRLGFTATPYRSSRGESLSLWGEMIYSYGVQDAIRDGVVVPPEVIHYTGEQTEPDLVCLEMISKAEGPGVVSAVDIADAVAFAELTTSHGFFSRAIHSQQSKKEQADLIQSLGRGELHHLVHVNMLTEGVDLPWLRWLCLRRPSASRIRFAQEVGRVLRSHPGKTCGVVYDPYDLFGKLSLSYEACLGEIEDRSADEQAAWDLDFAIQELKREEPGTTAHRERKILAMTKVTAYIRSARITFQSCGLADMKIPTGKWRQLPVSEPQMELLGKVYRSGKYATDKHQKALLEAIKVAHELDAGDVSDLISIFKGLAKAKKWPVEVADA